MKITLIILFLNLICVFSASAQMNFFQGLLDHGCGNPTDASSFHKNLDGSCARNTVDCSSSIANASSASKIWSFFGNGYGSCGLISCNSGFGVSGNSCVSLSCPLPWGGTIAANTSVTAYSSNASCLASAEALMGL